MSPLKIFGIALLLVMALYWLGYGLILLVLWASSPIENSIPKREKSCEDLDKTDTH